MAIIEIQGLSKSYRVYQKQEGLVASLRGLFHREYRAVQAVGHRSDGRAGRVRGLSGPNGAGKTTTLKLLSGVINPTSRPGPVMGTSPGGAKTPTAAASPWSWARRTNSGGTCPPRNRSACISRSTGSSPDRSSAPGRTDRSARRVRQLLRQPVRELSLGERMKMELIAALLHSPDVLFLDEPTIGLDVVAQHNIQQFLKHYQQERQITILLTSHYMKDVAALCRRVVIIANGTDPVRRLAQRNHRPLQRSQGRDPAVGRGAVSSRRPGLQFGEVLDFLEAAQGQAARGGAAVAGPWRPAGRLRRGRRQRRGSSAGRGDRRTVLRSK
jgi:ABC-2 type transport system ATP-binding protein